MFDEIQLNQQLGKEVNLLEMGDLLLDGYNYGLKALATDTVVDAKGKVKTKYSKEVAGQIARPSSGFRSRRLGFLGCTEISPGIRGLHRLCRDAL